MQHAKTSSKYAGRLTKCPASRLTPLAVCLFFAMALPDAARAELYFAPELIASDPEMVADLSRFGEAGAQLPGNYQVDILVNGDMKANRNVRFIDVAEDNASPESRDKPREDLRDDTHLMACLTPKDLADFGINVNAFPLLKAMAADSCVSPGKFIPDAFSRFDFQHMRLEISVPQAAMLNSARGYIPPERWDNGINALMVNYNFNGNSSHGSYGDSSSHFLSLNSGINWGPWRLRDDRTWSETVNRYYRSRHWQRLKTYAERAVIPLRSELTIGDASTSGDVFDSLSLRGVQLASDENMYPDSLRGFAPVIRGVAQTNAKITIRQNGYSVYQAFVPPGPFVINDLYPVYASGDLEVTLTEADGSRRLFTVPYSSVPVLQREGHVKYSLAAGRFQNSGGAYSSPQFVEASLMGGLPHGLTTYTGLQYSSDYFSLLLGAGMNLGVLGALSADVTQAQSTLADGSRHKGQSLRFLYARSLNALGTTFQLTGYRYSTAGFHTLDETALKAMSGWRSDQQDVDASGRLRPRAGSDYYNLYSNRRAKIQASVSQRIGKVSSIYLSGIHQSYWNRSGSSESLQAGFNGTWHSLSYSLNYSYNRVSGQNATDRAIFFSFSLPLETLLHSESDTARNTLYATYNATRDQSGGLSQQAGLSGTALTEGNLSWNLSQGYSPRDGDSGNASASYQGRYADGNVGYSYSSAYRQTSYGVSGGMLLHRHGLTLGQPLGETNVLVAAPGLSDVAVENQTGVHTDWRGYALLPYVSMYRENRVALDTQSLGDHVDLDNAVSHVVPTRGAIVRAAFKGRTGNRVLMTLTLHGKPLPFGATAISGDRSGIVGDEGLVYLSGLPQQGSVEVTWGAGADQRCTVPFRLPADALQQQVVKINGVCR